MTRKKPLDPRGQERQQRFITSMQEQGFRRKTLWIRPCDEALGKEHAIQGLDGEPPAKCHIPSYLLGYAMHLDPINRTPQVKATTPDLPTTPAPNYPLTHKARDPRSAFPSFEDWTPEDARTYLLGFWSGRRATPSTPIPRGLHAALWLIGHAMGTLSALHASTDLPPHPSEIAWEELSRKVPL